MALKISSFCIFLSLLSAACGSIQTNVHANRGSSEEQTINKEKPVERVTQIKATLSTTGLSSWAADEMRLRGRETMRSVFFLDALHGWAGGKGALYSTADSGKTWLPVDIGLPENTSVLQVVFLDLKNGWIVMQSEASSPLRYQDNHYYVMHSGDGGKTWKTQLEGADAVVVGLQFTTEKEVWVAGTKYVSLNPLRGQDFVFHSLDSGEDWMDVSGPLNRILDTLPIRQGLTAFYGEGALTLSVLLPEGSVFKTSDGGRSWRQQNGSIDDSSYACSCHLGMTDRGSWVGGDKDDSRSVFGMIAVKEGNAWTEYFLWDTSFADIKFLSQDRILTCGSAAPNRTKEKDQRYAAVSYSADRGATWSVVYRNSKARSLNALATVDSDHAWAVGDDGLILRLTSTSSESKNVAAK